MKNRNRFVMFLLMGCFEGLYLLYWQCSVQNGIKTYDKKEIGGGLTLLFSILTFGIYALVWQWKACDFLEKHGCAKLKITTLILSLFIIGIVINPLLIQGQINVFAKSNNGFISYE